MTIVIKGKNSKVILEMFCATLGHIDLKITSGIMTIDSILEVGMAEAKSLREFFISLGTQKEMWYGRQCWETQYFSFSAICEPYQEVRFTVRQDDTWTPYNVHYTMDIVIEFAQLATIGKAAKAFGPG